jgi:hypothetical protein
MSAKILLINGYATKLYCKQLDYDRGLQVNFAAELQSGLAESFLWGIETECSLMEFFNPFFQLSLFNRELLLAQNKKQLNTLYEVLNQGHFETLVCHSLGARLVFEYLKHFELPGSVKNIVFVQGCLPKVMVEKNEQFLKKTEHINITNYYCWWDNALLSYNLIGGGLTVGQAGINSNLAVNKFFPLYKKINLHTSSIYDERFRGEILKL